eukprot:9159340-Ditylum_brightwellii.AAC.1
MEDIAWNIDIYINNEGVIKIYKMQKDYNYDYPYNTLKPDWDVVVQAIEAIVSFKDKVTVSHTKGHQDNNTQYNSLDLSAKSNVNADELAGKF